MLAHWSWDDKDGNAARKLADRLPASVFDAHAHLYRLGDLGPDIPTLAAGGPAVADRGDWQRSMDRLLGAGRAANGLFFPYPTAACNVAAANAFLLGQLDGAPDSRGLILVTPAMDRAAAEKLLRHKGVAGFKPYHVFSPSTPTFQAPLASYLPEWAWELAHERGLVITLHMVRDRALADPDNQREILSHAARFPNAQLVLAHGARGFHAPNTASAIGLLKDLRNVWFDASGLCEPAALVAILEAFGPRRLMWGSDFPVNELRGKCVTIGDNFAWINPERVDLPAGSPAVHPYPVGIENVMAVLAAADALSLNDADRRDIFGDNARRLLGLLKESGTLTQDLYKHARERIPGGVHLLSKRPEMFAPNQWPPYFREARGCEVWDLDGRHYYDFSINGIGANLLGFADPDVSNAVIRRVRLGSNSTLNPPEEVELADRLCAIHPWADKVKLARTGGELAAVAVRIARSTTDRSAVAICGYHGWADWYLAANLGDNDSLRGHLLPGLDPYGVPGELRGTVYPFAYNDRAALSRIFAEQGKRLAAVVMEPCRGADPEPGFLEFVREETRKAGTLLIFDEITIGWRLHYGGSHLRYNIQPDMAMFAKALGNGHPIAAVIGTAAAMEGAHASFISSSYWTESVGPTAALATLDKMEALKLPALIARQGTRIMEVLKTTAKRHGLPLAVKGFPCAPSLAFEHEQSNLLKTLYIQTMLERGFLAGGLIYVTLAHTDAMIDTFAATLDETFGLMADALRQGDVEKRLKGPPAHTGFKRLI
jgi:glutamate-1-semialdehyde 2,1-aminomutase